MLLLCSRMEIVIRRQVLLEHVSLLFGEVEDLQAHQHLEPQHQHLGPRS